MSQDVPKSWLEFLRAHASITRELDQEMRAEHGLSLNEYEVLLQLWLSGEGRMRRVDLAQRLLISQGGITRLLAGLERRGLVARVPSPDDARVAYAEMTAEGRRLISVARRSHLADVRRLFADRFSGAELEQLAELLGRLSPPRAP